MESLSARHPRDCEFEGTGGNSQYGACQERSSASIDKAPCEYSCAMNKKEIESPKLTADFLIWTTVFILLLFALLAHFVWKVF